MSVEQKDIHNREQSKNEISTYRSIFKATSLFGGVQLYQILIGVIRSKFIALILGPTGMGISGLYTSAIALIKSLSSMGLQSSAVRDVSEAYGSNNQSKINTIITSLRKLVWITGLLGMAIVFFCSPLLSKSTFGDYSYILPFMLLSVTLLIDQLTVGQNAILQGTRRLKVLAKSSAIGSTIGLFVTIPMYYFMGIDGIVPVLVIASIISFLLAHYYAKKVPFEKVRLSFKQVLRNGNVMLKMGIAMSVNGLLVTASAYILRIFIMHQGGAVAVGLFTAGAAILTTYVGMIFSAISADYYPRLAGVNKDNEKCRELINQEGEIGTLILAPCLIICVFFMPLIIQILYSSEFNASSEYVLWASLGMLFKMGSWVAAFIFIAKSDMKTFLGNEITNMVYGLLLSIGGYYLWGLKGLGIAFSVKFFIYMLQIFIVSRVKYNFSPSLGFAKVFIVQFVLMSFALGGIIFLNGFSLWILGGLLIILSITYSLISLNSRMNLIGLIKSRRK